MSIIRAILLLFTYQKGNNILQNLSKVMVATEHHLAEMATVVIEPSTEQPTAPKGDCPAAALAIPCVAQVTAITKSATTSPRLATKDRCCNFLWRSTAPMTMPFPTALASSRRASTDPCTHLSHTGMSEKSWGRFLLEFSLAFAFIFYSIDSSF